MTTEYKEYGNTNNDIGGVKFSQIIPLMSEVHRTNGKFVPNIGIPAAMKQKEEVIVERVMEHCGFKTVMACVLGILSLLFAILFIYIFPIK